MSDLHFQMPNVALKYQEKGDRTFSPITSHIFPPLSLFQPAALLNEEWTANSCSPWSMHSTYLWGGGGREIQETQLFEPSLNTSTGLQTCYGCYFPFKHLHFYNRQQNKKWQLTRKGWGTMVVDHYCQSITVKGTEGHGHLQLHYPLWTENPRATAMHPSPTPNALRST